MQRNAPAERTRRAARRRVLGAAAASATLLAACGSSGSSTSTSASTSAGTSAAAKPSNLTIGFVPSLASDPFFISMQYGAQQEAKKLGVKLIWQGPSGVYSPSAQLPYVNAVLAQKPNAFILVPTDASALLPSVEQAKASGIPVITVDTTVTNTSILASHITGDNTGGGKLAAKLLNGALGGKGQVYLMTGNPGVTTEEQRQSGFTAGLKSYPGLSYKGLQYTKDQPSLAETEIQDVLTRFPKMGGIFAIDDTAAQGVIKGLQSANALGRVKVVAYDAEPPEVAALKAAQVTALVAQRPAVEGALAVLYAYDAATHKTASIKHSVVIPDVLLNKSTVANDSQWFYCSNVTSCSITWQPTSANGAP